MDDPQHGCPAVFSNSASSSPTPAALTLTERWLVFAFFAAAFGLRILYAWHFRVDSDEPQHLHVVWAWTQGLLPYRNVFDNHMPVFQALCAPLFHALGVRADILAPMRLAMLPIFAATIWCVWKCARAFCAPRKALWAAVFATFWPPFFFTSIEFRPDELWTLAWLLTLTVLVSGRVTPARLFAAGLVLGFSFCVSMKTSLLLAALVFALAATLILRRRVEWSLVAKCVGTALPGMLAMPAIVVLFFVARGAGPQMFQCVIRHNILPDASGEGKILHSITHWLVWLLAIAVSGAQIARLRMPDAARSRLAFAFFAAAFYYTTLVSFWPILTAEDFLPFFPAMMITAGPALLWLADSAGARWRLGSCVFPTMLAAGQIAWIVSAHHFLPLLPASLKAFVTDTSASPFTDEMADRIGIVADVLKLTNADECVMDSKGETIYRNRAAPHLILEGLTLRRLHRGLLTDDIAGKLIETRTPVVTLRRMPEAAKEFMKANYVPVAFRLSVLGQILREDWTRGFAPVKFTIAVQSRYTLVSRSGTVRGTLDGTPFDGPRELAAGTHEFRLKSPGGKLYLIWAQAIERGYSPFTPIKQDVTTEQD